MGLEPSRIELVVRRNPSAVGGRGHNGVVGDWEASVARTNSRDTGDAGWRGSGSLEAADSLGGRRGGGDQGGDAENRQKIPQVPDNRHFEMSDESWDRKCVGGCR